MLYPELDEIENLVPRPTDGEWCLLNHLRGTLGKYCDIFFQPYLNGDRPDFIVLRKDHGVAVIEVKDWDLNAYYFDNDGQLRLRKNSVPKLSPFDQVKRYKDGLLETYIPGLAEAKALNRRLYGVIKCAVYMHCSHHAQAHEFFSHHAKQASHRLTQIVAHDSLLNSGIIERLLGARNGQFTNDIYDEFCRVLKPPVHDLIKLERIELTKEQITVAMSRPGKQKVRGVVGSGKTTVLAHRAVGAATRTGRPILILCFNITLRSYIHDVISRIPHGPGLKDFHILHFHGFLRSLHTNHAIPTDWDEQQSCGEPDIQALASFLPHSDRPIDQYETVLVDEGQDFKYEWFEFLAAHILSPGGEFVIFADEKQNIYNRELEQRLPRTNVAGNWGTLKHTQRFGRIGIHLAAAFQAKFYSGKYELDDAKDRDCLSDEWIRYARLPARVLPHDLFALLQRITSDLNEHWSDVAVLCPQIKRLRELEQLCRKNRIHCITTFERQETYDALETRLSPEDFRKELIKIRRSKKFNFWMGSGLLKLSTVHSFKGWEINTVVLVIDRSDEDPNFTTDEMIYTGLTRFRRNLVILNLADQKYHRFFQSLVASLDLAGTASKMAEGSEGVSGPSCGNRNVERERNGSA